MTTTQTHPNAGQSSARKRFPALRRRLGAALKVVIVAALAGWLVYKLKFSPAPVLSHGVTRGPVTSEVMGTGTLEARVGATISPKVQGRLAEVLVDQDEWVEAGQILARLDQAEWRGMVAVAQAGLEAAMATVERVRADEARARAVLEQAQLEHERALNLRQVKVAAESDLDKAIENLRVAEADLKRAQAAIVEAERQRTTAEKTLRYHEARLADTRLISPFQGLVVERERDPGDVVVPGSAVLQLIDTNELWISAWVDETALASLATGQSARVIFRSEPTNHYAGVVSRLGRQTDRETREFLVDVRVAQLPRNWAVGQRAEVYIHSQSKASALLLPKSWLVWRDGTPGVFLAVRGRARWQPIEIGLEGRGHVEILAGLQDGDRAVKPIDNRPGPLRDGRRIQERNHEPRGS